MNMENLILIGTVAGSILVAITLIGLVLTRLYRRASKEVSFVRTGFGGQKVIMNGGALVLPVLHDIIQVNMNTLRLEVARVNEQALITKDRMRVDVQAEFYVRVKPTLEAIADAAQTLGKKTLNSDELKALVEGKFVDALRSVAAEMRMEELHEKRTDFVQKVQAAVMEDLLKNGLELETVSLTALDQTSRDFFNPQNAFDAQGLTKLTEEIEHRRRERNEIEQDTEVAIAQKNLQAKRQALEVQRETEYATLEQQREIEIRRASQSTEIAQQRAQKIQATREAEIAAKLATDQAEIEAGKRLEEVRILTEREIKEREISKHQALETAGVTSRRAIELAEQDKAIAIAEKSQAQSEALAKADAARAIAARAEEQIATARATEIAERQKAIELVEARKQAERDAIAIQVAAEAERLAAQDKAAAVRTQAEAEAGKLRIAADAEAGAEMARAEAAERRFAVDAAGKRALNEANNLLSPEVIRMQIKLELIQHLAEIIHESARPMERIEGIKILQVQGLGGGSGAAPAGAENGSLSEQVVNSALRYRAQAPLLDSLLRELGINGGKLNGFTEAFTETANQNGKVPPEPDSRPAHQD